MSQENVEIVRRSFEAFNARAIDELISFSHPDSEWLPFRAQLEGIVYRGYEGVRQFVRDIDEEWQSYRIDPLEFHDRGDRVAVIGRVGALDRGGHLDIDAVAGFVVELRSGQITRVTSHSDPARALEALE
jgi:ketosteroid isomerase-like protein